ncbi:MAG: MogA/MoaB family molybdenum cofactor biosynthesis protein, partial [Magnetococcales bacterium]|nr:MogA/MoaB family molybdenum cofactor biosynthesis protein [Magnetococcales bacterium]
DSRDRSTDLSGDALEACALTWGGSVIKRVILPDERGQICRTLEDYADNEKLDIILTTGGTGVGPRDVTPEATREVCDRELPGLAEQIRLRGLEQVRSALLTRGVVAMRGNSVVVNLPGSTRGARFSLEVVADLLPHVTRMAQGGGH